MRRILFLLSRFLDGGIDAVLLDYLRALAQQKDYSITLSVSIHMGELEVFRKQIPEQVKVVYLVDQPMLTHWRQQKITRRLPIYVKAYDEMLLAPIRRYMIGHKLRQLADQHDVFIDFDCCQYAFLKHIPVKKIAWFHFSFKHLMEQNPRRTQRIGKHLAYYDRIVVISKAMQEEGEELFPWLNGKWSLIYNAKDKAMLEHRASEPVNDNRIQQPYILAVERLEESQKDTTTLLHAYKILKDTWQQPEKLYILGKGRDKEMLQRKASELGIQDDVAFLGFTPNPYPWIKHAQMIAHSAKMEGLPTAMIESLILGKLMVATNCPTGPREILDDGKAGLLVPVGDAQAMADAIHRLLSDETLRQQLHSQAEKHYQTFLFESTLRLFKQLI